MKPDWNTLIRIFASVVETDEVIKKARDLITEIIDDKANDSDDMRQ